MIWPRLQAILTRRNGLASGVLSDKMPQMRAILLFALASVLGLCDLHADNMKAFPPADPGMTRHVIRLPAKSDESDRKVELIVGKTVELEPRNTYFFAGRIEQKEIPGWGFTRYVVQKLGPMAGTLMAVDPASPKVKRFVAIGGEPFLVRYNSRLPIVVYVPEGAEVRYRIWSASDKTQTVPQG